METNASDYVLATILSIVNKENKVYLVTFYSYTFTVACCSNHLLERHL